MYLSVIYLFFAALFIFVTVFISRRRNLRFLISFSVLFILMYITSLFNLLDKYFNLISLDILNGTKHILSTRIASEGEMHRFIYANIYLLFFLYTITGLFIRRKSNFRDFNNIAIKTTLKVLMIIFNSISFSLVLALFFVNANTYLNFELGFLSYIFDIAGRVVLRLWKKKINYFSYQNL